MKVVVTGASGFLGNALMRKLNQPGIAVIGVSRRVVPGLVHVSNYGEAPDGDVLVHLAEASDRHWVEKNGRSYEHATLGTLKSLLDKRYGRVVYASSAVLYGDQDVVPRRVEDPVKIVDTYTRLKYSSEQLVLGGNGVVARLVNLYGPGMAEGNVLTALLQQVRRNGPVRLLNLSPVRDFLWIDDAAEALLCMSIGYGSGIFNVGTGTGTSILQLANIVLKAAGQKGRLVESIRRDTERSQLVVDIASTVSQFGWRPTTSLPEGLQILVDLIIQKGIQ